MIKLIINEEEVAVDFAKKLNISRRNCMKRKEELEEGIKDTIKKYKDTIFGAVNLACMACLGELRRKQVLDKKVYDQKLIADTLRKLAWNGLHKNIMMDGDTMIDRRTGEVLDLHVDFTCWKNKFQGPIL